MGWFSWPLRNAERGGLTSQTWGQDNKGSRIIWYWYVSELRLKLVFNNRHPERERSAILKSDISFHFLAIGGHNCRVRGGKRSGGAWFPSATYKSNGMRRPKGLNLERGGGRETLNKRIKTWLMSGFNKLIGLGAVTLTGDPAQAEWLYIPEDCTQTPQLLRSMSQCRYLLYH